MSRYAVLIESKSERREIAQFKSLTDAEDVCKKMVDAVLAEHFREGMLPDELFQLYLIWGDDPVIEAMNGDKAPFVAWEYARDRCQLLCGNSPA